MSLIDEVRMDRTKLEVSRTGLPSGDVAYWLTRPMEERLAALELTRQVFNGYDPATTRFQRVLEVTRSPWSEVPPDRRVRG
ncbi:MAG: hypothetical protein JNL98_19425 [Bryobacterales bacterium]|nr:hypothetical protein [Bryobacterales bacterium]